MKTKIGELYNKPIVIGNPNDITKDEILLKNDGEGITLSERKNGELEDITNNPPKYPRCFIWYKQTEFYSPIGHYYDNGLGIAESIGTSYDNLAIIKFQNDGVDENGDISDFDTFLNLHKGEYKEISLKEFMGEYPEGNFGFIDLYSNQNFAGSQFTQVITTLNNKNTKIRLNYLVNNPYKANLLRLFDPSDFKYIPIKVNSPYYNIDKENNCIIFETEPIPQLNMATQIRVSLDAEVVNN